MATDAQNKANKLNAQKSSGPNTPEGKAVSSRNAMTHGLSARHLFIAGEDPREFEALRADLIEGLEPVTTLDAILVDKVAADLWRLLRVPAFEAAMIDWIAYQQHRTHDTQLSEHCPDQDNRGVFVDSRADGERYEYRLCGRTLEAMLSRGDLLTKLARHEAHLARQIRQALEDLRQSKKDRGEKSIGGEGANRGRGDPVSRLLNM